uniref:DUF3108 domain-containing protein n=1 Tax=candidate division WOR-3 bacterium TaxID=2052148 RepID=A0A7C3N7W2_UNCW3
MEKFIKKFLLTLFIILTVNCAKDFKTQSSQYSKFFKSGTTLVYEVSSWGDMYTLKVEIEKIKGDLTYKYTLSDGNVVGEGEINISKKSLENSIKIFMNFWDGGIVDTKEKTSILFSKKVFRDLVNKKEVTIDVGDGEEHLTFGNKDSYFCVVDGKEIELKCINASSDLFGYFSILDDYSFPLILKMEVGYIIELKEIITR